MKKIIDFLDGKKTYIGAGIMFVAGGLKAINAIDQQTFEIIAAFAGVVITVGLRLAVKDLVSKKK
jgi:hypothetical protein